MKVVVDDKVPFLEGVLDRFFDVVYKPGDQIGHNDLVDADALLIRTRTQCSNTLLQNTAIKMIATATIGYDHIDTEYCSKAGIEWRNAPGCNAWAVEQYVVAAILELAVKYSLPVDQLTLGVVGVGHVGSKVAAAGEALGMRVLLCDPPRQRVEGGNFVPLATILEECDIITFHVPLTVEGEDRTYHMADDFFFAKLRRMPIIINSSRGEVVMGDALKRALIARSVKGAVLDVWEKEPNIDVELLRLVDIATPHIAGYSVEGKANGTTMAVREISQFFGLGINDWYPQSVPKPLNSLIGATGDAFPDYLYGLVSRAYRVVNDDLSLRLTPSGFEHLRAQYAFRNEFSAYTIEDNGTLDKEWIERFKQLGFQVR